jgi:Ankyrin repeats (3 copies)
MQARDEVGEPRLAPSESSKQHLQLTKNDSASSPTPSAKFKHAGHEQENAVEPDRSPTETKPTSPRGSSSKNGTAATTPAVAATFKSRRRLFAKNIVEEDDDGDNLTAMERDFLRAVSTGQVKEAELLLSRGVNVHVQNSFERDGMQIAARNGNNSMLDMLFRHDGKISSKGPRGDSLFHLAAHNGHVTTMKWLHTHGIFPEGLDMLGQSVVHVAARRGELEVLKYLHMELDLSFMEADFEGQLPIDAVPRRGYGPFDLQEVRQFIASIMAAVAIKKAQQQQRDGSMATQPRQQPAQDRTGYALPELVTTKSFKYYNDET